MGNESIATLNDNHYDRAIITAASDSYANFLFAMIGSLNCNWPGHPPVLVYDIGLQQDSIEELERAKVPVIRVPPFCEHWRYHYSWKVWCMNAAPCETFLWLDAGVSVLRPLEEVFHCAESLGYFFVPAGYPLSWGVNEFLRDRFSVDEKVLCEIPSIFACFFAMNRHKCRTVIDRAFELCLIEDAMKCLKAYDRHDQDVISLLMHLHSGPLVYADQKLFGEWIAPEMHHCQKIWCHRRRIRSEDIDFFRRYLDKPGHPHIPRAPEYLHPPLNRLQRLRIWFAKKRGRYAYPPALPQPTGGGIHDGVRDNFV